jgi:hypothetical protein
MHLELQLFKYFATTGRDQNYIHEQVKSRSNSDDAYYYSGQNLLSSHLLCKVH